MKFVKTVTFFYNSYNIKLEKLDNHCYTNFRIVSEINDLKSLSININNDYKTLYDYRILDIHNYLNKPKNETNEFVLPIPNYILYPHLFELVINCKSKKIKIKYDIYSLEHDELVPRSQIYTMTKNTNLSNAKYIIQLNNENNVIHNSDYQIIAKIKKKFDHFSLYEINQYYDILMLRKKINKFDSTEYYIIELYDK